MPRKMGRCGWKPSRGGGVHGGGLRFQQPNTSTIGAMGLGLAFWFLAFLNGSKGCAHLPQMAVQLDAFHHTLPGIVEHRGKMKGNHQQTRVRTEPACGVWFAVQEEKAVRNRAKVFSRQHHIIAIDSENRFYAPQSSMVIRVEAVLALFRGGAVLLPLEEPLQAIHRGFMALHPRRFGINFLHRGALDIIHDRRCQYAFSDVFRHFNAACRIHMLQRRRPRGQGGRSWVEVFLVPNFDQLIRTEGLGRGNSSNR